MYIDHFGLTSPPFRLTPDARFYFESRTHKRAMAYLRFGLTQGEGFIVITGDIGDGKTTLVEHLMTTIDRARLTAIRLATTQVGGDDLLRLAAQGLGIPIDSVSKGSLLGQVEQKLRERARAGRRVVLIVDEAQNLPLSALEELRMLSNFQTGDKPLLQILLLGQPEFREWLNEAPELEQLRQRVIATHHLDAMSADEVGPYIEHRLARAGSTGRPRFTADAFDALFQHSDGVPRRLNTLADRVLLQASIEATDEIDEPLVHHVAENGADDAVALHMGGEWGGFDEPGIPARKLAELEARLEAQDAALRRVLSLLLEWVEADRRHDDRAGEALR